MRVFNGILIQFDQLVKSEQWMVSQGNTQDQNPGVIQEGLNNPQLYIQKGLILNVLHVELYTKLENGLQPHLFASKATNKAIFQGYVDLYHKYTQFQ